MEDKRTSEKGERVEMEKKRSEKTIENTLASWAGGTKQFNVNFPSPNHL